MQHNNDSIGVSACLPDGPPAECCTPNLSGLTACSRRGATL
jgi:hypothetical protein